MNFHVGQKVICVDDHEPNTPTGLPGMDGLTKGRIYTIREVGLTSWIDNDPCVKLAEIVRQPIDGPYWMRRFRPVIERKADISVFTEILNTAGAPKQPANV